MAQLSGMPNQPSFVVFLWNVAPTAATEGSPQRTRISQRNCAAAWSASGGIISMMWPKRLSARGLAASTWAAVLRLLFVSIA